MDDKATDAVITAAAISPAPRLFDLARECLRVKHYSLRMVRSYLQWIRRFMMFHGRRHLRSRHTGDSSVSDPPDGQGQGVGLDAESGKECSAVSVP